MRKIFLFTLFSIINFGVFAQSFEANPTSVSVPRFANQTAISAAIPSPAAGTLVYNNTLNKFAFYDGSAWVNFPSGNSTTPPTTSNSVQIPVYAAFADLALITSPIAEGMIVYVTQDKQLYIRESGQWRPASPWQISGLNTQYPVGNVFIGNTHTVNIGSNSLSVQGFSRFGTDASPAIKTKLIRGVTSGPSQDNQIPHGLDASKIISVSVAIQWPINPSGSDFVWVLPFDPINGYTYRVTYNNTAIQIFLNDNTVRQVLGNRPYYIYITYTN